jgi:hypothetical protein
MHSGATSRIRIFRADTMEWTPFSPDRPTPEEFSRAGIEYVGSPASAQIILARTLSQFRGLNTLPKQFAIWTSEPRFELHIVSPARVPGFARPVHIMNAYMGVHEDNYLHMWGHDAPPDRDAALRAFAAKPLRAAMLATYYPAGHFSERAIPMADPSGTLVQKSDGQLLRRGRDIDLTQRRQALALHLQRQGFCDIYGRDWPASAEVSGDSRHGDWPGTKQEILQNFAFNLAFENTIAEHYVTEKIWDAIKGACLPVYHGNGSGIYEDLPRGSFIEAAGKTNAALGKEIMTMGRREAADRYETCLDAYLTITRENRHRDSVGALLRRTVSFLQAIVPAPTPAPTL